MSDLSQHWNPGVRAFAVIDFSGVGNAGESITIGGVAYLEADTAVPASGIWTNGASAADSATSLAAAINGDTRATAPKVSAVVSAEGNSVIVVADDERDAYAYAITKSSGMANATVEDMSRNQKAGRKRLWTVSHTVTAADVLANEVNIPLSAVPTGFMFDVYSSGAKLAVDSVATIQTSPDRFRLVFSGTTDPSADDVVAVILWTNDG